MEKINMTKIINYFTYKYHGDWDSIYYAIQNKEKINIDEMENFSKTNKIFLMYQLLMNIIQITLNQYICHL